MDENQMLEKILNLTEENNRMLKSMRSGLRWARFFKAVYWTIIIASLVGTYYYIQPIINSFGASWGQIEQGIQSIKGTGSGIDLNNLPPEIKNALNIGVKPGQ